jgi:hypothetical protein
MCRLAQVSPLALGAILLATSGAPAEERPHRMSGTGQFVSPTDFVSEGIATHLGKFHEAGSVQFSPTEVPTVFQIDGWAVHTAANGDQVFELISGQVDVLTGAGKATATYVGGTGRFADARGSATISVQLLAGGAYDFTGEGTIDF